MSSRRSRSLTNPERPRGGRWRRPAWKDPRMAGGVVLVAAAVALGAWAVDAAADTTRVYVLSQDVAPGADLAADGVLTVVEAHPGTDAYVEAGHLPDGAVADTVHAQGGAAGDGGRQQRPGTGPAAGGPSMSPPTCRPRRRSATTSICGSCPRKALRAGQRPRRPPLRRPGRTDRLLRAVKATNQDRPGESKPAAWPQDWSSHRSVRPARG